MPIHSRFTVLQILLGKDSPCSKNKLGEDLPIPKFIHLKIWRQDGVESLTTLEEGELKVSIDGCINYPESNTSACTHPDSSWPTTWVSHNAVPLWLLQFGVPLRILLGYSVVAACAVAFVTVVSVYPPSTRLWVLRQVHVITHRNSP